VEEEEGGVGQGAGVTPAIGQRAGVTTSDWPFLQKGQETSDVTKNTETHSGMLLLCSAACEPSGWTPSCEWTRCLPLRRADGTVCRPVALLMRAGPPWA